ncbi:RNA ligase RtcB family protein [Permianibacter aggregans]|uniref:3'-phosphate/5'-hydroxy nucleic acid ligase n=1 Tax=Permianibacter aggregans TaxID=1510150 RepID=A0A4R6UBU5_9GAMM|nr:RNA ligase RtcB family protein [Permianibacter aggregans]TDQ44140.1 release factor H-coupled RctB family protein [Permianibacter aggregans]
MDTIIKNLSEAVSLIASENTWIEGTAIQQLHHVATLSGVTKVVGMPDLHPGRGYPVGASCFSIGRFYPALVGNDIGCGMSLWQTDITTNKLHMDKLEKRIGSIDLPLDQNWHTEIAELGLSDVPFRHALGTIGRGNHFAELQQLDQVLDAVSLQTLGIERRQLLLLVHSGSRGLGESVLRAHTEQFGHAGLEQGSAPAEQYLAQHQQALHYAVGNRQLIARRLLNKLRAEGECLLDVNHNLVSAATIDGQQGWLHRKGATPTDQGIVVIPGSRGDYSYLVAPIADSRSLFSIAHGAGRKWMRSECKDRLNQRFGVEQLRRTSFGSRVICDDKALLFEEAPQAYKPIDSIVEVLQQAGLIRVLARLKPVLTYKTREECC